MKILQISNRVPWPLNEGGTIGIYNYSRTYSEMGHAVTLYCLDGLKHNTPIQEAQQELSKYAATLIHPIDTDIKWDEALKHLLSNKSYNVSRFYNKTFEQELRTLLQTDTFDVIQLEGTFVGPYLPVVQAYHKGILALRMHNVEFEIWERLATNEKNFIKKAYLKRLAKQLRTYEGNLIKKVDVIATVTDDDAYKFKELHPEGNYITIPAGIDLNEWTYSPMSSHNEWYHIGSMEWHGNVDAVDWFLKNVHALLVDKFQNYQLNLAGKSINASEYEAFPNVKINPDVPKAYDFVAECDVCAVPLRSGSGIRLKILEAMAAGKLVISTTIGAQGIDYIDGEHLLIADKPSDFVAIYEKLQNGELDVERITANARQLIENSYSTEALASKQLAYYINL